MGNYKDDTITTIGTLYAKDKRVVQGKKDPTKTYEFWSYILEKSKVKRWMVEGKDKQATVTDYLKFSLPMGFDPESFFLGDYIKVIWEYQGKKFPKKDPSGNPTADFWYISDAKAVKIEFAQMEDGSIVNDSRAYIRKEDVFVPPTEADDDNEDDSLPF